MTSLSAADLVAACSSLVLEEIEVLQSIYEGLLEVKTNTSDRPGTVLHLSIPITLPSATSITLQSIGPSPSSSSNPELNVTHLPALALRLYLPPSYPLQQPPKAISLRGPIASAQGSTSWLSRKVLDQVQSRMRTMWEEDRELMGGEGAGVIWKWWEWVGNGDFLSDLGLLRDDQLGLTVPPQFFVTSFHTALKTYNAAQLHSSFESSAFSCTICFENRKGKSCIQMPECGCVFCTPCLSSCWTLAINEGTIENVSCPSVSCTKTRATREGGLQDDGLDGVLIESVVGAELKERWVDLKERRRAEIDPTYTTCPQPWCQAPVPPPPPLSVTNSSTQDSPPKRSVIRLVDIGKSQPGASSSAESSTTSADPADDRWERYRCCPKCRFSFCLYCSATWHGPHTLCALPQASALVLEYLSYPEDSDERRRMEIRKGKANLERMVNQWREDEENKRWFNERTRACSGCGVRVEKSHGCNHMTCGRCKAHFCYRCGDSLSPMDPYAHYRVPGRPCFERLFDQEEIDRFERETAMGRGVVMDLPGFGQLDDEPWPELRGIWEW